jgi:molybdate transport system substrate-binding protein
MKRPFILTALCVALLGVGSAPPPPRVDVPCVNQLVDIHGDPARADLVLFIAGNQWFVMPRLLQAFRRMHPEVKNVYYETLPPGILARQIESGALQIGDFVVRVRPDVYVAGKRRMTQVAAAGYVEAPSVFASNVLAIMVKQGNPKHIRTMADLGRADVRVAMPNPKNEGIARQIELSFKKAGGDALDRTIVQTKVKAGTTVFTQIHHRQTPMWILDGKADAGPVWISEALYQQSIHSGLVPVPIPKAENVTARYLVAVVKHAPHAAAARAFQAFLISPAGRAVYHSFGYQSPLSIEE